METDLFGQPSSMSQAAIVQDAFTFPAGLTETYCPRVIQDFVGLDKVKRLAQNLVRSPRQIALLFKGPSGTGKTTMALALARAIPAEVHHIPSQECTLANLQRVRDTCQYVPMSGRKMHLILIDEGDQMSPAAQIAMLSMTDCTNFPPATIIIVTCNSTDRLEDRFLSRFQQVEFSSYGIAQPTAQLLETIWNKECTVPDAPRPNFARIVKDASNNVRAALMTLQTELMCA